VSQVTRPKAGEDGSTQAVTVPASIMS